MPEGVEVLISTEMIKPLVLNRPVISFQPSQEGRYKNSPVEGLAEFGKEVSTWRAPPIIKDVVCKGKFMYWTISNEDNKSNWYMFCTFGMTGQWSPQEGKHPCFSIHFLDNPREVYFNDPRHFGTIKFVSSEKELKNKLSELGWDPLHDDGLTAPWLNWLKSELSKSNKPIGQMLLDQSLFAGVGNYIRAEALYLAKMSPWRVSKSLSKEELEELCGSIVEVMAESYKYQGATLLTYKDAYGNEGRYSSCFKVYGRRADPLGNIITKESTPEGRTIHWCPTIQI